MCIYLVYEFDFILPIENVAHKHDISKGTVSQFYHQLCIKTKENMWLTNHK